MRKLLTLFLIGPAWLYAQAPPTTASPASAPLPTQETVVVTGSWTSVPLEESERSVGSYPVAGETNLFGNLGDVFAQDASVSVQWSAGRLLDTRRFL